MSSGGSWLLAVDLQRVFAEPASPWCAPDFAPALAGTLRLLPAFAGRTALTRFVAPKTPAGAWVDYYRDWPFAVDADRTAQYDLVEELAGLGAPVVDRTTFGKWDAGTRALLDDPAELVITGVSTDCCVLSTALPAADAGLRVTVVTDACAGASETDHQRALDAMALYAPLIRLRTVDEVLGDHAP